MAMDLNRLRTVLTLFVILFFSNVLFAAEDFVKIKDDKTAIELEHQTKKNTRKTVGRDRTILISKTNPDARLRVPQKEQY